MHVHAFLLWFEISKPLTRVDTEHGFSRNLKASGERIRSRCWRRGGFSGLPAALPQPQHALRKNASQFTAALLGQKLGGVIAVAHGWLRPAGIVRRK